MEKLIAYLRLMRPANIMTAIADIMFGFAASGSAIKFLYEKDSWVEINNIESLGWLIISTSGLYGGGIVLNDVFDSELDKLERPERPIPSGKASRRTAIFLGAFLLCIGIAAAYKVSLLSVIVASAIALLAISYNAYSKHHSILGPLNMGACRGGNLMLGMSAISSSIMNFWFLALIPIVYIGVITLISRGEVNGINKKSFLNALVIYFLLLLAILNLSFVKKFSFLFAFPFFALFVFLTLPPLLAAFKNGKQEDIRKAVKAGVLALIVLDASLAAGFAGIEYGLIILMLLPLSVFLSKSFSVT
jgi:4-hydroxybenzoate polyprenyltransferase